MISNFDLNINNYSRIELEQIFELPPNYDENIIEIKETKLKQNILGDISVPSEIKKNTSTFLALAKAKLIEFLRNSKLVNHGAELVKTYKNVYNIDKSLRPTETIAQGGTFIIDKEKTPYGKSMPSEFYQGTINPLDKRIIRKNLNIDTRFRDNYYSTQSSNIHIDLPIRFTNVVSLQLSAFELPKTFYAVSKVFGNNYFTISYVDGANSGSITVIVPDGNYTYTSFQNYINTFLDSLTDTYLSRINFQVDISGDSGSGRMVVGINPGPLFNFTLDFASDINGHPDPNTPLPLKLGWLMGFREGEYVNNSAYVSEGIFDLLGPRYIYLVVDEYTNSTNDGFYGVFNSSILNKNILARISLQGAPFNFLSQNNLTLITTPRQYFGPIDIQKLNIQLLDEYGRILNLNNMDYSLCLTFQTIYDL